MPRRTRSILRAIGFGIFVGGCLVLMLGDIWHETNVVAVGTTEVVIGFFLMLFL